MEIKPNLYESKSDLFFNIAVLKCNPTLLSLLLMEISNSPVTKEYHNISPLPIILGYRLTTPKTRKYFVKSISVFEDKLIITSDAFYVRATFLHVIRDLADDLKATEYMTLHYTYVTNCLDIYDDKSLVERLELIGNKPNYLELINTIKGINRFTHKLPKNDIIQ